MGTQSRLSFGNACELLAKAREEPHCYPPLTEMFASLVILLDHTWCPIICLKFAVGPK